MTWSKTWLIWNDPVHLDVYLVNICLYQVFVDVRSHWFEE